MILEILVNMMELYHNLVLYYSRVLFDRMAEIQENKFKNFLFSSFISLNIYDLLNVVNMMYQLHRLYL